MLMTFLLLKLMAFNLGYWVTFGSISAAKELYFMHCSFKYKNVQHNTAWLKMNSFLLLLTKLLSITNFTIDIKFMNRSPIFNELFS